MSTESLATITAHENTRKHLFTSMRVDGWNFTFPPSPANAIPTEVFNADKPLHLNGAAIALKHYDPSHTDGDVSAYFMEADVLHTGDTPVERTLSLHRLFNRWNNPVQYTITYERPNSGAP